ncbi:hypothetical protein [Erythrobacter colymbi]|uniref:hypothetical protein n=1 Tax=Erythrobacter colymbi TaxID=1161202 RepID=UPI000A37B0E7|nr:hypothetical protein [Erythrobacter colymbi]
MAALRNWFGIVALGCVALAQPLAVTPVATAKSRVALAEHSAVAGAARLCLEATSSLQVDTSKILNAGWVEQSPKPEGRSFQNAESNIEIIVGEGACLVRAALSSSSEARLIMLIDLSNLSGKAFRETGKGFLLEQSDRSLLFYVDKDYYEKPSKVKIDVRFTGEK